MKGKPIRNGEISGSHKGKKHTEEWKVNMRSIMKGRKFPQLRGENHHNWVQDRSKLKKYVGSEEKRSQEYRFWRKQVKERDDFVCRIADNNCDGRLEVHHILSWSEFPELRFKINNGITLCQAHHPRRRAEEKRLIPTFLELVSMSVSKQ